jgi:hypothetical protein
MDQARIFRVVSDIRYPGVSFFLGRHGPSGPLYLQVEATVEDATTGESSLMHGRKWHLSEWSTDSEVVQTAWLAVKTWLEHEARERFTYRGRSVFGPHLSVSALSDLVDRAAFDVRGRR